MIGTPVQNVELRVDGQTGDSLHESNHVLVVLSVVAVRAVDLRDREAADEDVVLALGNREVERVVVVVHLGGVNRLREKRVKRVSLAYRVKTSSKRSRLDITGFMSSITT